MVYRRIWNADVFAYRRRPPPKTAEALTPSVLYETPQRDGPDLLRDSSSHELHRHTRRFPCPHPAQLRAAVASHVGFSATDVDVLPWMPRAALELIGQAGLGHSFDPLTSEERNEYGDALKDLMCASALSTPILSAC